MPRVFRRVRRTPVPEPDTADVQRVPPTSIDQLRAEAEIQAKAERDRAIFDALDLDLSIEEFRPTLSTPGLGSFRTKL